MNQTQKKFSDLSLIPKSMGFSGSSSGKECACRCRRHKKCGFDPWIGRIPWRRAWQPTPVFLPGEFHGQKSLVGFSPQGCKELYTTEVTQHACNKVNSRTASRTCFQYFSNIHVSGGDREKNERRTKQMEQEVYKNIVRGFFKKGFCFDTLQPIACGFLSLNIYKFFLCLKYFLTHRGLPR